MKKKLVRVTALFIIVAISVFAFLISRDDSRPSVGRLTYETKADSSQECSSYEDFDEARKVCFYECDNKTQCRRISDAIDQEFKDYREGLTDSEQAHDETPSTEDDVRVTYSVTHGEKITIAAGQKTDNDKQLWTDIKTISPDDLSNRFIEKFQIYDDQNSDTVAFVIDEDGNGKFTVGVNTARYDESTQKEKASTIIHELGHIVTLNSDEQGDENCGGYKTDEGCFLEDSPMTLFADEFWSDETQAGESDRAEDKSVFVSDYAASSPEEDIAESFAFYVLSGKARGETIADKKVAFFDQFDYLRHIKSEMRHSIARIVVKDTVS